MFASLLSHCLITEKLGAGVMGELYRAEDTNIDRKVGGKVLPDIFGGGLGISQSSAYGER